MVLSARGDAVERFYSPPPLRRLRQEQQAAPAPNPKSTPPPPTTPELDDSPLIPQSPSPPPPRCSPAGNLKRFLEATTPLVPARRFPKTAARLWRGRAVGEASRPYFVLGELWESFAEWSAYGAGVPLVLNGTDCVVQYYVPFLSAIQLYVDSSTPDLRSQPLGEELDDKAFLESSSAGSSGRDGSSGDDSECCDPPKLPIFEYLEHDEPYKREPLADKITVLANNFSGLMTYKSCDLLPSSWISIAWYPIYRIPIGSTLRDLDACFLTYHFLGTPSGSSIIGHSETIGPWSNKNWDSSHIHNSLLDKIPLSIFGLASYKLKTSIWTSSGPHEVNSLLQAAGTWLHHLRVAHPDYRFFLSHQTHV